VLRTFLGHTAQVLCVAFSPDGRRVLSGDSKETVRQWDLETGMERRSFTLGTGPVTTTCFSVDGREIYAAGPSSAEVDKQRSYHPRVWDSETGVVQRRMESVRGAALAMPMILAFSPGGKRFLCVETMSVPGRLQLCKIIGPALSGSSASTAIIGIAPWFSR
jgi:WD40 repeat protein